MSRCSVCGALVGDGDLVCPSCHSKNIRLERLDVSYYPFQKSVTDCAANEKMSSILIADGLVIGLILLAVSLL